MTEYNLVAAQRTSMFILKISSKDILRVWN